MVRNQTALVLACGLAGAAALSLASSEPSRLGATTPNVLADADGDFLPDMIEWAVMTSAANPDTDGDGTEDFIEVVQGGAPRYPDDPLALDHEMRVVISAPPAGNGDTTSWMHLLIRLAVDPTSVDSFAVWFQPAWAPGFKVPLESLFAGAVVNQRLTANHGAWLCASVPLVSSSLLHALLPCGIYAEATIDGHLHRTGVSLLDLQGEVVCLVPYGPRGSDRFAFQTIAQPLAVLPATNKVCVIDLNEVGSGPGGTVFEIVAANCEDCNELECGSSCPQSVGWLLTVPGGLSALGN